MLLGEFAFNPQFQPNCSTLLKAHPLPYSRLKFYNVEMSPVELKELLRLSEEADKQRKLMGVDDRSLRQAIEVSNDIDRINKHRANLMMPAQVQDQIDQMRAAMNERAALAMAPLMESIAAANTAAFGLVDVFRLNQAAIDLTSIGAMHADDWRKTLGAYGGISINKYLEDQFKFLSERSFLAQVNLAGIDLATRVPNLGIAENVLSSSLAAFDSFSESYKQLFESYSVRATTLLDIPPHLTEFPTYEYFNEVELLSTTAEHDDQGEFTEQIVIVREEIREETTDLVTVRLQSANPDWIKMLEGARQSLRSDNPDKIRHSITSLRELVREIMHHLSPEDDLRAWSTSADHFANNRPTRKARLQYIARDIDHGKFSDFVRKDIESMIEMINLFQSGTHASNSPLTEQQVAALLARVEGAVLFLFAIANAGVDQ